MHQGKTTIYGCSDATKKFGTARGEAWPDQGLEQGTQHRPRREKSWSRSARIALCRLIPKKPTSLQCYTYSASLSTPIRPALWTSLDQFLAPSCVFMQKKGHSVHFGFETGRFYDMIGSSRIWNQAVSAYSPVAQITYYK